MVPVSANREVLEFVRDGIDVEFRSEDGTMVRERVRVIDWRDPTANDLLLVSQGWFAGELHTRRTDLIGYVNGVPLLFVELKAGHRRIEDAYRDNIRDYRDTIPQLFAPTGFVLVSNGLETRIGAGVYAPWDTFKEWKRIDDETEPGRVSLETAIRAAATPERLLDLVESFLIFQETRDGLIKMVAQNHQYLGVNKAVAAVGRLGENRGRLGVFWHTQGSGKSLSMLTFARKVLRTMPGAWTFVIVTDREELDEQIAETFAACGAVTKSLDEVRAGSKRAPEDPVARQRTVRLHADPQIRHGVGRDLSHALRAIRHHRHHRRGAPSRSTTRLPPTCAGRCRTPPSSASPARR